MTHYCCSGLILYTKDGKVLLEDRERINKHGEHWSFFGGSLKEGETKEQALVREIKEETGLDIENSEFLKVEEIRDSKDYTKNKHIVSLAYKAILKDDKQESKLDGREATEFFWMKPKDILKRDDVEEHTYGAIEELFVKNGDYNRSDVGQNNGKHQKKQPPFLRPDSGPKSIEHISEPCFRINNIFLRFFR